MPHILLTGAGFSRNWGGWLADEAFEYLLGSRHINDESRSLLWRYKNQGGFEAALGELQKECAKHSTLPPLEQLPQLEKLARLEVAIQQMFGDMNRAFSTIDFEFQQSRESQLCPYLSRFDAIFTLNQDLLIDQHYIRGKYQLDSDSRWKGCETPGIERIWDESTEFIDMQWSPFDDPKRFAVKGNVQPYFKLHGSSNWIDTINGRRVLVLGGNKSATIGVHKILQWNHDRFKEYLSRPDTRLMVIGYSFGDHHINQTIGDAADSGTLRVFIIDPLGVDVLRREHMFMYAGYLGDKLPPYLIGGSRRTLREIFGGDMVEHGKVMRFFD